MIRPKEKFVVNVNQAIVNNTDLKIIPLYHNSAVTFPGTVTGLMWELIGYQATITTLVYWAIVIQRAGTVPVTLNMAGPSVDYYDPETNILAWGIIPVVASDATAGPIVARHAGKSKGMRKFQNGDKLVLLCMSNINTNVTLTGNIQFFYLS